MLFDLTKFQDEVGGPLRGGDPGVRLISNSGAPQDGYSNEIPGAFQSRSTGFLIVPLHHIFGSEELSALSPPVAERSSAPYAAVSAEDMKALGVSTGNTVVVSFSEASYQVAVIERPLPQGMVGLHVGRDGLPAAGLPVWGAIEKTVSHSSSDVEGA